MIAAAEMAHVAPPGAGRTLVIITLSGGDPAAREALGAQVIAAARAPLAPAPPVNRLAAVFAQLRQPPAPVATQPRNFGQTLATGTVLPAEPARPPVSPYEAPFVLAPLRRRE